LVRGQDTFDVRRRSDPREQLLPARAKDLHEKEVLEVHDRVLHLVPGRREEAQRP